MKKKKRIKDSDEKEKEKTLRSKKDLKSDAFGVEIKAFWIWAIQALAILDVIRVSIKGGGMGLMPSLTCTLAKTQWLLSTMRR